MDDTLINTDEGMHEPEANDGKILYRIINE